ncbi:MAG: nuclear transport factor 2 family protein [Flavobacteriales bacterium]|nr:nuclear transport factor 2 family protein [Flavobacteriales bacterium]MBK6752751.1 nuclear transport factor 2 family protein [Flavobacteriales bacterium]MBK9075912.1 nuclear transport factor 2 family protein [Flavobacteriales bacterium]MBK9537322.1 nuclear transport factor 2 family protein [Flavobacteriales bacterium]
MSVITRFYTAFAQRDWATMGACYHDQARFGDPAFPDLDAAGVRAMWKMLVTGGKDLRIIFTVLEENTSGGKAHWDAYYTFSKTGRKVHNSITATFTFKDGLILTHQDHFDFWRWSRQALGISGLLLGWTLMLRKKVQGVAAGSLRSFRAKEGA